MGVQGVPLKKQKTYPKFGPNKGARVFPCQKTNKITINSVNKVTTPKINVKFLKNLWIPSGGKLEQGRRTSLLTPRLELFRNAS